MAPGDIYTDLKELSEGDLVQAKDPSGLWYNATIVGKRLRGANTTVTVHYVGYPKNQDETFNVKQQKVRERLPRKDLVAEQQATIWGGRNENQNSDGSWPVECILRSRGSGKSTKYLVRWAGDWGPEHDEWLPRPFIALANFVETTAVNVEADPLGVLRAHREMQAPRARLPSALLPPRPPCDLGRFWVRNRSIWQGKGGSAFK